MRHTLLYTILLCAITSVAQPYKDITSDWCKMGLKGQVKEEQGIYYLSASSKEERYSINKSVIKYSEDGYILNISRDIDGDNRFKESYHYFSPTDKSKGYIHIWQRGLTRSKDSVITEILSDTSFTLYSYNTEYGYKETSTYTFNHQQQLISLSEKLKDMSQYTVRYTYNKLGQKICETSTHDGGPFNVHTVFDVLETDDMQNPTSIVDTFKNADVPMASKQNITYTYYE